MQKKHFSVRKVNKDMERTKTEELSKRGEIFRSKLIEGFQLLDTLTSKGSIETPRFYSNEIQDPDIMDKLLKESPFSLVKFQVYSKRNDLKFNDRRLNRVRNKNKIPFGPWARTVTESAGVQNFIMFLIITNSLALGIQAEISDMTGSVINWIKVLLEIFDYITLVVFVMEILVKWLDGFFIFWKNGWNVFDFFVTAMAVVPEVISLVVGGNSSSSISVIGDNMRVFRILRSLKMVSRFAQLRIIVLTIFKAFKSMAFILILLLLFMYVFAVAGTILFDSYAKSSRNDLKYRTSFSTLKDAFITLFQLFTLDHWYEILNDMVKAVNPNVAKIYVLLWICVGAFVFRNIFAGIMVNNFQNIRNEFNQQIMEQMAERERTEYRNNLAEELDKLDKRHKHSRRVSESVAETQQMMDSKENRSGSVMNKFFRKKTNGAPLKPLKEEPQRKEEEPKHLQPKFATQLQAKIAKLRSKERNQPGTAKCSSSFHAYFARDREDTSQDLESTSDKNAPEWKSQVEMNVPEIFKSYEGEENMDTIADSIPQKDTKNKLNEPKEVKRMESDHEKANDAEADFSDWQKIVEANLHNFQKYPVETMWPRNVLFKYFQVMEQLQENLVERKQLNKLLGIS
ncbi:cation channel sperm-associated protein 2-like [Xenia sp. Carnegie-2017]|uniref:cation channel sperm-associated protein 2-like n=1 Tax=Xenia sp. Carnegie-2017 TaxID=2897299 RepID=UPI001F03EE43|nr:cation channel sperm-associated protein 2-like [Xenia sp. Carnegie-2017]